MIRFTALLLFLFLATAPLMADQKADSDFFRCCANIKNIGTASEMYSVDSRGKYPSSLNQLAPSYLKKIPSCPAAGKPTYRYRLDKKLSYVVECHGKHHLSAGMGNNQPRYNGKQGLVPKAVAAKYQSLKRRVLAARPAIACKENLKNIATALEMYSFDNKGRYPQSFKPLVPNYLRKLPLCPAARRDSYTATYKVGTKPDSFSFYCQGHHHKSERFPANFPAYDSHNGLKSGPSKSR